MPQFGSDENRFMSRAVIFFLFSGIRKQSSKTVMRSQRVTPAREKKIPPVRTDKQITFFNSIVHSHSFISSAMNLPCLVGLMARNEFLGLFFFFFFFKSHTAPISFFNHWEPQVTFWRASPTECFIHENETAQVVGLTFVAPLTPSKKSLRLSEQACAWVSVLARTYTQMHGEREKREREEIESS